MDRRELVCGTVAFGLVIGGTLATGVLPASGPYQVVAGGIIVAGFALILYCFSDWG